MKTMMLTRAQATRLAQTTKEQASLLDLDEAKKELQAEGADVSDRQAVNWLEVNKQLFRLLDTLSAMSTTMEPQPDDIVARVQD